MIIQFCCWIAEKISSALHFKIHRISIYFKSTKEHSRSWSIKDAVKYAVNPIHVHEYLRRLAMFWRGKEICEEYISPVTVFIYTHTLLFTQDSCIYMAQFSHTKSRTL